jgi:hypothetical protein
MRSLGEIDGLVILAVALVGVTIYSVLRNFFARAAREQAQRVKVLQQAESQATQRRRAA